MPQVVETSADHLDFGSTLPLTHYRHRHILRALQLGEALVNDRIRLAASLVAVAAATVFSVPALAQMPCEDLAHLQLTNVTINSASSVPAGPYTPPSTPGAPPGTFNLPAYCKVQAIARPSSDSAIKMEIWLPASGWNGKFEQVGNGGFAGTIPLFAMVSPLLRGYATAGTDDGHVGGTDVSWAIGHPEKVIDFGYRAVHETSVQAKAIIRAFYGKDPSHSYFVGCSDGGREALMEAQRYPADFIGIVAGAPASDWTHLMFKGLWDERAVALDPASYIPASKLPAIQKAALAACDGLDGLKDGIIENPRACHFDPVVIQCQGADSDDCLTPPQVETARAIYGLVKNSRTGAEIAPGFSPGAEADPANWRVWILGAGPGQAAAGSFFANNFFAYMVFEDPKKDWRSVNFDSDVALTDNKIAPVVSSMNPDLREFKRQGGKLIQYHGWGDAGIPPQESVDYFENVQSKMGKTDGFYRLFMVPAMSHCGGGLGTNVFGNGLFVSSPDADHDIVLALDRWVETGTAPDQIIATRFVDNNPAKGVQMTRPLCPYPEVAHYKGTGDANDASNFVCQLPGKSKK